MSHYKDTFLKDKETWIQQPNAMFPAVLKDAQSMECLELQKPLMVVDRTDFHAGGTWFKPSTLEELLALLHEFGGSGVGACKIVVGNTEVGIGKCFLAAKRFISKINVSRHSHGAFGFVLPFRDQVQARCVSSPYLSF
jgi:hypothetical protein